VKFELIKLHQLCGRRATVYSVSIDDEEYTLFEKFLIENQKEYEKEVSHIKSQIKAMAQSTGVRDRYFKKPEGKPGQDIWDLRDQPYRHLRMYCMRITGAVIILGGGGPKPKEIRAFQENPKLHWENNQLRMVSDAITQRIKDGDIYWINDGLELAGDFIFDDPTDDP